MILSENSIFFFLKNESVLNLTARKEVNIMKNKKMLLIAGVLAAFLMLAVPFAVASVDSEDVDAGSTTNVARIGVTEYATLQDAITAADSGATIEILNDFSSSEKITIEKNLTIDGNNHTYSYGGSGTNARAIDVPYDENDHSDTNLTINDLNIVCSSDYCQRGINYNVGGELTLNNVSVSGKNVTYALNLPGSSDGANIRINNSDLTGCIALNVWGEDVTVIATGSDFTCVDQSAEEAYTAIALNNDGTTAAEGSTIDIIGGSVIVDNKAEGDPSSATSNMTFSGTIELSNSTEVKGPHIRPVAFVKYGDAGYAVTSLQDAIIQVNENPNEGYVIELVGEIVIDDKLRSYGDITINGHGCEITILPGATFTIDSGSSLVLNDAPINNEGMMVVEGDFSSNSTISGKGLAIGDKVDDATGLPTDMTKEESNLTDDTSKIESDTNAIVIDNGGDFNQSIEVSLIDSDNNSISVTFPNGASFSPMSAVSMDTYEIPGVYDTVYDVSFYGISGYGDVLIKLPKTGEGTPVVYHIDEDGNILETYDESEGTYSDSEYVYFYTDHNSLYMVSYINSSPGILPGMGTATEGSSEGFSTADYATMAGIVIAVAMLVGLVCIVRRN